MNNNNNSIVMNTINNKYNMNNNNMNNMNNSNDDERVVKVYLDVLNRLKQYVNEIENRIKEKKMECSNLQQRMEIIKSEEKLIRKNFVEDFEFKKSEVDKKMGMINNKFEINRLRLRIQKDKLKHEIDLIDMRIRQKERKQQEKQIEMEMKRNTRGGELI
ncbi:uncharacterized protein ASCRUDRAFT_106960 [Ascoidea rubescens DSM 1968]|uniref:Uncharacterized protein n=1 Tax=Ascoidea rubescens DSM 1968 TaxID=1344418 RepID=A0A1D2VDW3_9ASCO|nr:hypothetical protein ASCRUDRAFT_106960 [Ascoidea rubescens DSM 1968]ODV59789.1 hypothetical protein ASCRUDRAFT_106960 [Ascoidea rubescens DSM 1968]